MESGGEADEPRGIAAVLEYESEQRKSPALGVLVLLRSGSQVGGECQEASYVYFRSFL